MYIERGEQSLLISTRYTLLVIDDTLKIEYVSSESHSHTLYTV